MYSAHHALRLGGLAVALGLGAAAATGYGVAAAEPSDSGSAATGPNSTDGATQDSDASGTTSSGTDAKSDSAPTQTSSASSSGTPATKLPASTVRIIKPVDSTEVSDSVRSDAEPILSTPPSPPSVPDYAVAHRSGGTAVPDKESDSPIREAFAAPDVRDPRPLDTPVTASQFSRLTTHFPSADQEFVGQAPAASMPTAAATAQAVISAPPAMSQPVTLRSIVVDVLTWLGLSQLATNLPMPPLPVPQLLEGLWLSVRRFEYTWNNQRPSAQPTVTGQQPFSGVITGQLNATDYDDDHLTYTIAEAPANGTVTVDYAGNFVYTPSAEFAQTGGEDAFTVTMDDTVGNPWHVHGLLDVVKLVPPSQSIVHITVSPVEKLTGTIQLGGSSFDVAISPDGSRAYVTNPGSNTVSVINTATNTVATTIPVSEPQWVALSPDGTRAYVTTDAVADFFNNVSVIDTTTNTVVATILAGRGAEDIQVSPDGTYVYVTNFFDHTVSVIDTATNTNVGAIPVGDAPGRIAFSPDGAYAYLADINDTVIRVINNTSHTIETSINVGSTPQFVSVSPDGTRIYVPNNGDKTVSVIDTATNTVIGTVPVGGIPNSAAVSPDGTLAYIVNFLDDSVSVIDTVTNTVIATVPVNDGPWNVAVSPDGTHVYITHLNDNVVSVISR